MLETKTQLNETTLEGLQDLIEINLDSSDGFSIAAEKIENGAIAEYFTACGRRRREFANELQTAVAVAGHTPQTSGTMKGAAHRCVGVDGGQGAAEDRLELRADPVRGAHEPGSLATAGSSAAWTGSRRISIPHGGSQPPTW